MTDPLRPTSTAGLEKIAEGREAEIFAWEDGWILRLFRDPAAASWAGREVAAMQAARSVVPLVPDVRETVEVEGRPGIVMQRVAGIDLLSRINRRPWTVWQAGRISGDSQAKLHGVQAPPGIEALKQRGRTLGQRTSLVPADVLRWSLERLEALPDGDRLLHGDFHPGNILLGPSGPVVIDWPNVTAGDPHADVARTLLMVRIGELPPGTGAVVRAGARVARGLLRTAYLRGYRRVRPLDKALVARWLPLRAVDRLAEDIPGERPALLQIIEQARAAG